MAVQLKKSRAVASLSILPLIDVVFLLIIFFLVATKFVRAEQELDMQLPTASEAAPLTSEIREVIVNIDKDGQYYMDGKFRLIEEVEEFLRTAATNNPDSQTVVIRCDRTADYEFFIQVIDVCKRVGIENYTTMTSDDSE